MAYNKKYADWNKKIWFEIIAPQKVFNEVSLGETPAYDPKSVIKRKVSLNLAFLTGNFRLQNMKAVFQIYDVKSNKAYTELVELSLYDAYVKRIVRKGTSRVDDSFEIETKDGIKIRIKPLIVTRYRAKRRQRAALRSTMKQLLSEKIPNMEFYELVDKIMKRELQNELFPTLNKIFPVGHVEIRKLVRVTPIVQEEENLIRIRR